MLTKITTLRYFGETSHRLTIEVDLRKGFPGFTIVGLPDTAVQEAKERIKSAIINSGLDFPFTYKIVVNLAPAALRKHGTSLDLPIALAILLASHRKTLPNHQNTVVLGELSLDGSLVQTQNLAPILLDAHKFGDSVVIPAANQQQAGLCRATVYTPRTLKEAFFHITKQRALQPFNLVPTLFPTRHTTDFADIIGHDHAKRALMIAATGRHHIRFSGPPGTGKTLLSSALPSILPPLTKAEQYAVTRMHAIANPNLDELEKVRPFRNPHHSCSVAAMTGGGNSPTPGEISLAHNGVLFLDEAPEFSRQVLETLRQPLESGNITITRSHWRATFPAKFLLVLSQNPCPCGFAFDPEHHCECTPAQVHRYQTKLSGPLLDRIDLHVAIGRAHGKSSLSSAQMREQVAQAREKLPHIKQLSAKLETGLKTMCAKLHLSLRAQHRIVKVAKTIATLEGSSEIKNTHLLEAVQYRK